MRKKIAVLIPEELNIEEICSTYDLDSNYLKYLIDYLSYKTAFYIEQSKKGYSKLTYLRKKYFPFKKEMKLVRNDKHKKHIELLISNNLTVTKRKGRTTYEEKETSIFYREDYEKGVKPYSYRFGGYFQNTKMKICYIDDFKLANKIVKLKSKYPSTITSGKYKFLKKFFNPTKLTIDLDRAVQLCEERFKNHKNYIKYINELVQITDLYNGIYRFYYNNETDGRIHSNITRLPKAYRKYLAYDGRPLVEIDLSNSIIYFLALLTNPDTKQLINENIPLVLMIYKTLEGIDNKEIQLFQELCFNGEIYNHFIPLFEKAFDEDELKNMHCVDSDKTYNGSYEQKRKLVKKQILAMIFAKTKDYKEIQKVFKMSFPIILEKINLFKTENEYKVLSHVLFQTEAICMIDKSARKFNAKNYRTAPVFTLHDCLITTKGNEEKLFQTMEEVFLSLLGTKPNMGIKHWD